jgi:hypothetical protein
MKTTGIRLRNDLNDGWLIIIWGHNTCFIDVWCGFWCDPLWECLQHLVLNTLHGWKQAHHFDKPCAVRGTLGLGKPWQRRFQVVEHYLGSKDHAWFARRPPFKGILKSTYSCWVCCERVAILMFNFDEPPRSSIFVWFKVILNPSFDR